MGLDVGVEAMKQHHRQSGDAVVELKGERVDEAYGQLLCRGSDLKNAILVDELLLPDIITIDDSYDHDQNDFDVIFLNDVKNESSFANHSRTKSRKRGEDGVVVIHDVGRQTPFLKSPGTKSRKGARNDVVILNDVKYESSFTSRRRARMASLAIDPTAEIGESSSPSTFCSICLEPKLLSDSFGMSGCSHMFCSDCIKQYVAIKIQENSAVIRCPDPECGEGSLEPERCQPILPPEVFERWCAVLCESLILGSARFYCPFNDCSAPLDDSSSCSEGKVIKESECPHCFRLFCAQCKVPWHAEISCEKFQKLGADERGNDDIKLKKLAEKNKWQRCPKCKFYVERTEGCRFMKCRCGYAFCYGCGTRMTKDHYCTVCKR